MTSALTKLITGVGMAAVMGLAGCGKLKQKGPADAATSRTEAKREQLACASPAAYDRVKGAIFDDAIRARNGDRANLDTLADYSQARMEQPMVESRDPVLDLTRCKGRLVLDIPPGAERGLGGERRLQADIAYSAQAAADGSGLVYKVDGAEQIIGKLAAFTLSGMAYRPPPAIDGPAAAPQATASKTMAQADVPPEPSIAPRQPAPAAEPQSASPAQHRVTVSQAAPARRAPAPPLAPADRRTSAPQPTSERPGRAPGHAPSETEPTSWAGAGRRSGEGTVRAFYRALGQGNGVAASAQIIPEKRTSRAYSPEAISQFYGRLPEPIQLTAIVPLSTGAYRVNYRYSAGRSHCNGAAVVRLTNRGGSNLISSIRALSGC